MASVMATNHKRLVPLDWMRGLVMIFMTLDHASEQYNLDRISSDSALYWTRHAPLPLDQFLIRWVTHLCAPTFVFLAGVGAALSFLTRRARDEPERKLDRDLLIRGTLILGLELIYLRALFGYPVLQVLYAIGVAMILLVPLRRLSPRVLALLAILWFVAGEILTGWVWPDPTQKPSVLTALLVAVGKESDAILLYAAIPWTALMALGWATGHGIHHRQQHQQPPWSIRELLLIGLGLVAVFVLIRGLNGYGNMFLYRDDGSLAHWLHTSKYPPSLSFMALELGLMMLWLALFTGGEKYVKVRSGGPLLVYGQTALFFYILHLPVLHVPYALGWLTKGSTTETLLATLWGLLVMYPLCVGYRKLKRRFPKSVLRFI